MSNNNNPNMDLMVGMGAQALSVYDETGLTPRQLAEQRDELLAMLEIMTDKFETRMDDMENPEFHDEYNAARALILKARAKP